MTRGTFRVIVFAMDVSVKDCDVLIGGEQIHYVVAVGSKPFPFRLEIEQRAMGDRRRLTTVDGTPTRLRVTVTKTVDNFFGGLFGIPTTTISRTAVADFAGPVPMGSPCNEFGNDPDPSTNKSANCADTGQFWANVGAAPRHQGNGDAYQNNICASGNDGCTGSTNNDYDPNGYFYTVTLSRPVNNLKIQAFDPAQVIVGDNCTQNLTGASSLTSAQAPPGSNPAVRYAKNDGPWCTGDTAINGGTGLIKTRFQVHVGGANAWDPLGWPVQAGCDRTFEPFSGDLSKALDHTSGATYQPDVAASFRRWTTLCTIPDAQPGTYTVQVRTNGLGNDAAAATTGSACGPTAARPRTTTPSPSPGTTRWHVRKHPQRHLQVLPGPGAQRRREVSSSTSGCTTSVTARSSGSTVTVLPPTETGGTFSRLHRGPVRW